MKYLIIGTGGTGGAIGGFLAANGKDVSFIARGAHLDAMRTRGLTIRSDRRGDLHIPDVQASEMKDYRGSPDVVFVCVKGYSLGDTIPFLRRAARPDTVVIPILNIYGTGGKMAARLPELTITDGCVYISSYVSAPGEITQRGNIFRVVFGMRDGSFPPVFDGIKADLTESGIDAVVSENIRRDAFQKFSCVSPMAAAGAYFDATVGELRSDPHRRSVYQQLVVEVGRLAQAMGIPFDTDVVQENLEILDQMTPESTASLQKDLKRGQKSEMDGLIFEVIRLGEKYRVPVPTYWKIAKHFGYSNVFDPIEVGGMELRNRIVRSATRDGVENEDGTVSDRQIRIFEELAENETGLIITGHLYVSPEGRASRSQNGICGDEFIPGLRRLTRAVHEREGCVVAQISHAGAKAIVPEPAAPGELELIPGKKARMLTEEEIGKICLDFADAASRAKQAGFDGVQIHMAHHYLLSQFLTPEMNTRTDDYGGSAENRFRICRRVIEEVRRECGHDYPVLVKLNSNVPQGDETYEAELIGLVRELEKLGVCAVELSGYDFSARRPDERNYYLDRAARVQQITGIPVILVGGIRSLSDIARVLDSGVRLVSFSRPFICQGDLVSRLRAGEKPRCTGCNQCFTLPQSRGIRCVFHQADERCGK